MATRRIGWTIGEGALSGGAGTSIVVALIDYLQVSYPEQPAQLWALLSALFGAIIVGGVAGTSKAVRTRAGNAPTPSKSDVYEEFENSLQSKTTKGE